MMTYPADLRFHARRAQEVPETVGGWPHASFMKPTALSFALLVGSAPELTADVVKAAYRAVKEAQRREEREPFKFGRGDIVKSLADLEFTDDELSRNLGQPVEGRPIVKPARPADTAALSGAVERFYDWERRLPDLRTWRDRQAVWNLLPGRRDEATPGTGAHHG